MSKKIKILIIILVIIAAGVAGFFAYQRGYLAPYLGKPSSVVSKKLFSLEVKNSNLSPETIQLYQTKIVEVQERLKKNPDDVDIWLSLAIIKKGVGDYEGARDILLYVSQRFPQSFAALFNLADLCANFLNEPQKAEEIYQELLEKYSDNANLYLALAELYRYRLPEKAALYEEVLLRGLEKLPDDPNLIGPLALYYRQTEQVSKAIEYYEKLVRLAPDNETAKQDLEELKKKNQ